MGKADFLSPKAIANRIKSKGLQKLRWYCQMCQKQCRDEVRKQTQTCFVSCVFCWWWCFILCCLLLWVSWQNGFKCHCMSESHQRQLLLASENPNKFMDYFSEWVHYGVVCSYALMSETVALNSTLVSLLSVSSKTTSWSCSGDVSVSRDPPRVTQMFAPTAAVYGQLFFSATPSSAGTKRVHNNIVYNEYISDREHVHMNSTQWETLTDFTKWLGREGKQSLWDSCNVCKTWDSLWGRPEISVNHIIIMWFNHSHSKMVLQFS